MVDREGTPLGRIMHIYLDEVTGEPEWALVATGEGDRRVFVPLVDAAAHEDQVRVPVGRALVADAPAIRAGRQLSKESTARLHGYYGGAPVLRCHPGCRRPVIFPIQNSRIPLETRTSRLWCGTDASRCYRASCSSR